MDEASSRTTGTIRVLHVDDEPDFADLAATFLERVDSQFTVETATSASDGLDHLADTTFDCVISDHDMPGMNGIEFLETLREQYDDLPFILYTGKGSEAVASHAISAGVTDYLQKQSGSEQYELLANRIRNAVSQHHAHQLATETEQRLQELSETTNDILWMLTADWNELLFINSAYEDIWGLSTDTLAEHPKDFLNGVHPNDQERLKEAMDRVSKGHTVDFEIRVNSDEDYQRWAWIQGTPITDDEGTVVRVAGFVRDITERKERETEIKAEGEFIKQALDALNDVFYVIGADGTIRRWNSHVREVTGYTDDELAGMQVTELFPEDEKEKIAHAIEETIMTGQSIVEANLLTKDDERIPYEFTGNQQSDTEGDVIGAIGIGRNISERKQRKEELEQSNAILSTVFEGLPVGIMAEDQNRNVLAVNERMFDLFELPGSPDEVVGADCERIAHEVSELFLDSDGFVERINELVVEQKPTDTEEFALNDGRIFKRSYRPIGLLDDDDGHLWVYRDITERKESKQELKELTEKLTEQYHYLFEEAPVMAVTTRPNNDEPIIDECNQLFLDTLGYDQSEVIGEELAEFYTPESAEALLDGGYDRALAGEFVREDRKLLTTDDEPVETLLRAVPRVDADESVAGTLAMFIDITERKQLERETDRLEEFTGIVSHDLRNPLNVAQGRLELAREESESDHLDDAANAVDRSLSLVGDLLTLAREGKEVSEFETSDLHGIIEICWQNVDTKGATLVTETGRTIRADASRLKQLLENLIRNAVEHGGEGVTITIGDLDDGFYVADDGPGIPGDEREQVFEPGYSTGDEGTGFGLNIVKEIVKAHGWQIRVTESKDGGARFEITGIEVS